MSWLIASLILNIVVLVPVCWGLLTNAPWTDASYGPVSPARGIVLAMYLAILLGSVVLLFVKDPKLIAVLLAVQIVYKIISPFTAGTFQNPVIVSNLCIAAFHLATLAFTFLVSNRKS
jgi:hypothetical protein